MWKIVTGGEDYIINKFSDILLERPLSSSKRLPKKITFITPEELHQMFPNIDIYDWETAGAKKFGAMFIIGMGWPMAGGSPAKKFRAIDYDDWNLNGDTIVLHSLIEYHHKLMSMGIRVDRGDLLAQLDLSFNSTRLSLKEINLSATVVGWAFLAS